GVITPVAIKQFVTLDTESGQEGIALVVEQTVAELSQTGAAAARDDLIERVEWVERVHWSVGLDFARTSASRLTGETRGVWRRNTVQVGSRRNCQGNLTRSEERTGRTGRQFVVGLDLGVV